MVILLLASLAHADWQWSAALPVGPAGTALFPHLDASGRKAIAASGTTVALAWEDSRGGAPRCWLGVKPHDAARFTETAFGQGECFEPGVAPLEGGRFLLVWEDEAGVQAAVASQAGIAAPLTLAPQGGQCSIVRHPSLGVFVAWSVREGRWRRIHLARLTLQGERLELVATQPADAAVLVDDQMFPVLAASDQGVTLAWEDRRLGHTVVYALRSEDGVHWGAPARVSQNPSGRIQGDLGRGTGAMRPTLAAFGPRLAVVWLDKRDFLSGYDVYAALSEGAGFGKNLKAQDSFGDALAQWHAAVAGNAQGDLVVAFDDERDGTADIWLTRWTGTGFADNVTPPPASGPGQQSDAVIALDDAGRLHLAWIDRQTERSARLLYAVGVRPQTANSGSEKPR